MIPPLLPGYPTPWDLPIDPGQPAPRSTREDAPDLGAIGIRQRHLALTSLVTPDDLQYIRLSEDSARVAGAPRMSLA